jgi:hypothetical protein
MSSHKKTNKDLWSISHSYKLTSQSQKYFYEYEQNSFDKLAHHAVQLEMELLDDIDIWVDLMDGQYPEAMQLINEIRNK